MPHIVVEYSDTLTDAFDRPGFGAALHPVVAKTVDTAVAGCKTRFRRIEEAHLADGAPDLAMIHIEVSILSGRDTGTKRELSAAVLEVARAHVSPVPGLTVQTTVDIRDLDRDCYEKHEAVHPA
ncbi:MULTISPECIES: 5-carboxymethyl-2-hydroxymuconate Delta-isomerase [Streptomyces]|uniref:5-carboxymethyl-2-hydroxymuconate isomerase n=1 Tax=Streptomyces melanosporofaciens TaxID=67327 RepID=A0A1H4M2E1_STRMJ|nr:5-carboxymethyl-2-hydroxymuconate Delta-isomerase [Streptomyces melanosporofaciens]SEB77260.1 5-carboxymethyl-2-hydroxymuconate isomerase [Streptomyces melanosporofaciens]